MAVNEFSLQITFKVLPLYLCCTLAAQVVAQSQQIYSKNRVPANLKTDLLRTDVVVCLIYICKLAVLIRAMAWRNLNYSD